MSFLREVSRTSDSFDAERERVIVEDDLGEQWIVFVDKGMSVTPRHKMWRKSLVWGVHDNRTNNNGDNEGEV